MFETATAGLLWFSAIGCGLLAGLYFAFSAFIMTALGRIEPVAGAAAMNAINSSILRSAFMPLFVGSTLSSLAVAVAGLADWTHPAAPAMVAGGMIYFAGMFGVTMAFNVPLNNALMSAGAAQAGAIWARYLKSWTRWNHVRTLASTTALLLFIQAIASSQA